MTNKDKYLTFGGIAVAVWLLSRKSGGSSSVAADVSYLGRNDLPKGMRNNNPLNIKYNSANRWQGALSFEENTDKTFEQFKTYKWGIRAAMKLLKNYFNQGRDTIQTITAKWAPGGSGEGNNPGNYSDFVAGYMGIGKHDRLGWNYNNIANLVIGMAAFENGRYNAVTPAQTKQVWEEFFGGIAGIGKLHDSYEAKAGGRVDSYWGGLNIKASYLGRKAGNQKHFIDAETAISKYNLHGIEFGNWMNQDDRVNFMYATMVSLSDMANVLSVPIYKMGLNQRISLAFGARGNGGFAAAIYVGSPLALINLTKTSGKGTFAHEYGHALDEHIHIKRIGGRGYMSGGRSERMKPDFGGIETNTVEYHFEKLFEILYWKKDRTPTDYGKNVKAAEGYWKRRTEVWARTFEKYISIKFAENNIKNSWATSKRAEMLPPKDLVQKARYHIQKIIAYALKA